METIIDIVGHSTLYGDIYRPDNSWYGKILLEKDHKFEGYVNNFDGDNCFLIFGEMSFKELRLIQLSKKDSNIPYLFSGKREGKKFYGDYYACDEFTQIPLGECMLSIVLEEDIKDKSNFEKRKIKMVTEELKQDLGEKGSRLLEIFEKDRMINNSTIKNNKTV